MPKNPRMNQGGASRCMRPRCIVTSQATTWIPAGIATSMLAAENRLARWCGMPMANMWWTQRRNEMTTTPEAKGDDATGTSGESVEQGDVGATPDEAAGGKRDCEATEKWSEQAMACVRK